MNWEHLKALVWLRYRLRVNQYRKAGALSTALAAIFVALAVVTGVTLLFVGFGVGLYAFDGVRPHVHLFVWDGIVVALLVCWMTGLLTELQRAEALAIDRLLHLPVSASGAFVINYLSSLANLTLIVFVPGMVGLIAGLVVSHGPALLLLVPLLAAFLFALTAVTYQFQGWLASLMANPRRRRTVVVVATAAFILLAQSPNLLNVLRPWQDGPTTRKTERINEVSQQMLANQIAPEEYNRRMKEITDQYEAERKQPSQTLDRVLGPVRVANTVLPPGWLPLAAEGLVEGSVLPALAGTLGLALIGTVSMRRAYRTTLRLYTGEFTGGDGKPAAKAAAAPFDPAKVRMVEWRLPWVGEHVSAVATAGLRSLTRAPEAKMALLGPVIMVVIFGGIMATNNFRPPAELRPLMAFGVGMMVVLASGMTLLANQFGYDRAGFRAYVLSPAARRDILVGKNLAVAPLALGLAVVGAAVVGTVYPMRFDHYPAVLAQVVSTFLIVCLLSNLLSILTPLPLAAGSMQAKNVKAGPVLLQMLMMMTLPVFVAPVLAPYGLELLLDKLDVVRGVPISLPLSLVLLALAVWTYRGVVRRQGAWLMRREQRVLEVVASKAE